jgi:proteasome assembly chaperone (PAC2) family protein
MNERPDLRGPALVAAFAGWPDAGEVASGSIRYLIRKLRPKKFASVDPDAFYVFTETRPNTTLNAAGQRSLEWPANDFYAWRDPSGVCDLVLFQAREPNINWRGYIDVVAGLIQELGVSQILLLGGQYDAVSHRGGVVLSGNASDASGRERLTSLGVEISNYQGPSSVQSALLDRCGKLSLPAASIWGHAPHYVRSAPNPKVSHAVLSALRRWLEVDVDLVELRIAGDQLETRIEEAMKDNAELRDYVEQLSVRERPVDPLDAEPGPSSRPPSTSEVLQELEELLRQNKPPEPDA